MNVEWNSANQSFIQAGRSWMLNFNMQHQYFLFTSFEILLINHFYHAFQNLLIAFGHSCC